MRDGAMMQRDLPKSKGTFKFKDFLRLINSVNPKKRGIIFYKSLLFLIFGAFGYYKLANISWAMLMVSSRSAVVCALDTKPAS